MVDLGNRTAIRGQRPLRVAFLLQDLKYGGTQRQTLELVKGLDRERFHPLVWTLAQGEDLTPLARQWGIEPVSLGRGSLVGPLALARLWRELARSKPDLLVLLTVVPNIWGRILGRTRPGLGLIGNCRNGAVWRQHERILWPLAHGLIANSRTISEFVARSYRISRTRVRTILNGVDSDFFRSPSKPPKGGPAILSVARMVRDKDQATLIAAFSRVLQEHPRARLMLVGEGPLKDRLRDLAARRLPPGSFSFPRTGTDIRAHYHSARVAALSSVQESLPNVILEAMACGLPVVSTLAGGTDELIAEGRTGFLVRPRDPAALARALGRILDDPALAQSMGREGRQRAVAEFPLERMIQGHQELFLELAARLGLG